MVISMEFCSWLQVKLAATGNAYDALGSFPARVAYTHNFQPNEELHMQNKVFYGL